MHLKSKWKRTVHGNREVRCTFACEETACYEDIRNREHGSFIKRGATHFLRCEIESEPGGIAEWFKE